MNYYKIHKNKNPKRLNKKRRFKSMLSIKLAAFTCVNLAQAKTSVLNNPFSASLQAATAAINQLSGTIKIIKEEQQRRFKLTGRYTAK